MVRQLYFGARQVEYYMKIKKLSLLNYKKFTELHIEQIPITSKLVVLVGPNGSGKSSLFDAFLMKSREKRGNFRLDREMEDYYINNTRDSHLNNATTQNISSRIQIDYHSIENGSNEKPLLLYMRSAYRNESDFRLSSIEAVKPSVDQDRISRIIDVDVAVSDNYRRLFWKRSTDVDNKPGNMTFEKYRSKFLGELQEILQNLFPDPKLVLQDFGGTNDFGVFRFSKGISRNFHYKNLSSGEKAAFDLLLDVFVNRSEYKDAIYCIDEPEAHMATALHAPLLDALLKLIPEESQLWIATHSIGFVRKAYEIKCQSDEVTFLNFSENNFDKCVTILPSNPNRSFWQTVYRVALDDLGELVAPSEIIICEGDRSKVSQGFDAECYNKLFSNSQPNTLFLSLGGSKEVENCEQIIAILKSVVSGVKVRKLVDRDEMPEGARLQKIEEGVNVLRRREIENYLYDPLVLKTFLRNNGYEMLIDDILKKYEELLQEPFNVNSNVDKRTQQNLLHVIKQLTKETNLGNSIQEFAIHHLVPALKTTASVFQELERDIFQTTTSH